MQPVIPLQPYIREGEGSGSAFVLPRNQRQSAMDILADNWQRKKTEEQAQNKMLQDQIIELDSIGKGLLPNEEKRIRDELNSYYDWVGFKSKSGGMNPANPMSADYIESQKRLNKIKSNANIGKVKKDMLKQVHDKALTGDYDMDSFNKIREYIVNTPLEEFDVNMIGELEKRFDPNIYEESLFKGKNIPYTKSFENVKIQGGKKVGNEVTRYDTKAAADILINDQTPKGDKLRSYYLDYFQGLPTAERDEIAKKVIKNNTAASTDPEILKKGILLEVARKRAAQKYGTITEFKQYDIDEGGGSKGYGGFNDRFTLTRSSITDPMQGKAAGVAFTDVEISPENPLRLIAIEPKKTAAGDNQTIQLPFNGKQVRPINYLVDDKSGKTYMTYAVKKKVSEDALGNPMYDEQVERKSVDTDSFPTLAAFYGYGGDNGVEDFKREVLQVKPKQKIASKAKTSFKSVPQGGFN